MKKLFFTTLFCSSIIFPVFAADTAYCFKEHTIMLNEKNTTAIASTEPIQTVFSSFDEARKHWQDISIFPLFFADNLVVLLSNEQLNMAPDLKNISTTSESPFTHAVCISTEHASHLCTYFDRFFTNPLTPPSKITGFESSVETLNAILCPQGHTQVPLNLPPTTFSTRKPISPGAGFSFCIPAAPSTPPRTIATHMLPPASRPATVQMMPFSLNRTQHLEQTILQKITEKRETDPEAAVAMIRVQLEKADKGSSTLSTAGITTLREWLSQLSPVPPDALSRTSFVPTVSAQIQLYGELPPPLAINMCRPPVPTGAPCVVTRNLTGAGVRAVAIQTQGPSEERRPDLDSDSGSDSGMNDLTGLLSDIGLNNDPTGEEDENPSVI